MKFKHYTILLLVAFIMGCVPRYQWKASAIEEGFSNNLFSSSITPLCSSKGCKSFMVNIENKTDNDIELNWNKSYFIKNNQTSGGFMFEGVVYRDRNNQKTSDIIFSKGKLSKVIWPTNLVSFSSGKYGGWEHASMPEGVNGMYLTINIGKKEVRKKLTHTFSKKLIKK